MDDGVCNRLILKKENIGTEYYGGFLCQKTDLTVRDLNTQFYSNAAVLV